MCSLNSDQLRSFSAIMHCSDSDNVTYKKVLKSLRCYRDPESFDFTFTWKIKDFTMGVPYLNQWLCSPALTLPLTKMSWELMLHPKFKSDKYVSLYLHRISEESAHENYEFEVTLGLVRIGIANTDERNGTSMRSIKRNAKSATARNVEKYEYWGSKSFISWASLILNKDALLPNDTLTITCQIKVSNFPDRHFLTSLLTDIKLIYDKETKYLNQPCGNDGYASSKETQITKTCDGDGILRNLISKIQTPVKPNHPGVKNQVLHKWFQHLYSEKLQDIHLQNLDSEFMLAILEDMKRWPNGVPKEGLFQTFLKTEETNFTSYIKDFSQLQLEDKFFSPAFQCASSEWKLMFCLSTTASGREVVKIFICPMSFHFLSKKIFKCKISVVTKDGRLPLSREHIHFYNSNGQWEHPPFIYTEFLNNNRNLYLENDILTLYCTFCTSDGIYSYDGAYSWTGTRYSNWHIDLYGMCHLREDLKDLLDSGLYSDVILKVDKSRIPAHKSILSQRSEKFRRIINGMHGKNKSVIEIQNISEETLKKVLRCIYCGNFDLDAQFLFNVKS